MFIVTPETVCNPGALETRRIPKKLIDRVAILPRRGASAGLIARLVLENQLLRFCVALTPFVVAMLIWQEAALPISQAPLVMLIVIGAVEMKLLRLSPQGRETVTTEAAAARTLDTLRFRANRILSRIAAGRGLADGTLHLVVEQSELARVPPLTLVSVQIDGARREVLALTASERAMIAAELFDAGLTEADLQRANLRENRYIRDIAFEARAVSGHARIAALAAARADQAAEAPA